MMRMVGSSSMVDAATVPAPASALTQSHPLGYSITSIREPDFLFWRRYFNPFTPARALPVSLEVV